MTDRAEIAMLWMRGSLSWLERLCVQSFLDHGHPVTLWSYDEIGGVPEGVRRADATAILSLDEPVVHERTGSPALHSDIFRYRLLDKRPGVIWADTDAYCLRPFETIDGHLGLFATDESFPGQIDKHLNDLLAS